MKIRFGLPQSRPALYEQARQAIDGLAKNPGLNVLHTTPATLEHASSSARDKFRDFLGARASRQTASISRRDVRAQAEDFVVLSRTQLRVYLGTRSEKWLETGFSSLGRPGSLPELLNLLETLAGYFEAHPEHENSARNVTKEQAIHWFETLSGASNNVKNSRGSQRIKRDTSVAADNELRELLRNLIRELEVVLEPHDQRWIDFGFRIPADAQIPEPVNVVRTDSSLPRHVRATWEASARADRFIVRAKVLGKDAEFRYVETTREARVDLNTFDAGDRVQIEVIAANAAGEAPASPVVEMQVA